MPRSVRTYNLDNTGDIIANFQRPANLPTQCVDLPYQENRTIDFDGRQCGPLEGGNDRIFLHSEPSASWLQIMKEGEAYWQNIIAPTYWGILRQIVNDQPLEWKQLWMIFCHLARQASEPYYVFEPMPGQTVDLFDRHGGPVEFEDQMSKGIQDGGRVVMVMAQITDVDNNPQWMLLVHEIPEKTITVFKHPFISPPASLEAATEYVQKYNFRHSGPREGRPLDLDMSDVAYRVIKLPSQRSSTSALWALDMMQRMLSRDTRQLDGTEVETRMLVEWELKIRDAIGVLFPGERQAITVADLTVHNASDGTSTTVFQPLRTAGDRATWNRELAGHVSRLGIDNEDIQGTGMIGREEGLMSQGETNQRAAVLIRARRVQRER